MHDRMTNLHRITQGELKGMQRSYAPNTEGEIAPPDESVPVPITVAEAIRQLRGPWAENVDVTLTRDKGNTDAVGTIQGFVLPPSAILWLEGKLQDLRTFVQKLTELDPNKTWTWDEHAQVWKAQPEQRMRVEKKQKPLVLYHATEKHPAQTQLIVEEIPVGVWTVQALSGGVPRSTKLQWLERIDRLQKECREAREEANSADTERFSVGEKLFDIIFSE